MTGQLFDDEIPRVPPALSGRAPKILFWLDVVTVGKLRYRQRGGGKFTNRDAMLAKQRELRSQGIEAVAYQSEPIVWKRVPGDG